MLPTLRGRLSVGKALPTRERATSNRHMRGERRTLGRGARSVARLRGDELPDEPVATAGVGGDVERAIGTLDDAAQPGVELVHHLLLEGDRVPAAVEEEDLKVAVLQDREHERALPATPLRTVEEGPAGRRDRRAPGAP